MQSVSETAEAAMHSDSNASLAKFYDAMSRLGIHEVKAVAVLDKVFSLTRAGIPVSLSWFEQSLQVDMGTAERFVQECHSRGWLAVSSGYEEVFLTQSGTDVVSAAIEAIELGERKQA